MRLEREAMRKVAALHPETILTRKVSALYPVDIVLMQKEVTELALPEIPLTLKEQALPHRVITPMRRAPGQMHPEIILMQKAVVELSLLGNPLMQKAEEP